MLINPKYMGNEEAENAYRLRNMILANTDWTQMPDSPLTTEQKAAWATYRQALRDVTAQEGFPNSIQWPVSP